MYVLSMSGDSGHEEVPDLPLADLGENLGVAVTVRALVSTVVGVAAGLGVSTVMDWQYGLLLGWITGAAVFMVWTWLIIWPMDAYSTARHAVREDPGRALADVVVVLAAVASLAAVGLLLTLGNASGGTDLHAALSVASVALAWSSVHTMFTTRYARLYYGGLDGGIDFNETDPPKYTDFAYLAFTIGMTFQVSDTDLKTKEMRATALRHALLSYLFGTFIIASMINLIAGLGR
ncbi:MAG: hypothetical protein QOI21_696 [Actinomycetota bacterium]|jgi:uncharacterized membrane protein|nr:hypothetical protein [Actinomycetota bacterium]